MNRLLHRPRKNAGRRVFLFVVAAIAVTVAPATAQTGMIGPGPGFWPPPLAIWAGTSNNTWTGPAPLEVDFSVWMLSGGAGPPYRWWWTFGDGPSTSSAQNPSHLYLNPGNYTATVTVTDSQGNWTSGTVAVSVYAPLVTITLTATPQTGPAPLAVTFDMSYTPIVQANHAYSWWLRIYDQNNNLVQTANGDLGTPAGTVTTTFTKPGTYWAYVWVDDNNGNGPIGSAMCSVLVFQPPPPPPMPGP
jgi:PKD repeat protein